MRALPSSDQAATGPARGRFLPAPHSTRRLALPTLLLGVLAALVLSAAFCRPASAAGVAADLTRILEREGLAGSGTGMYVWELDDGRSVYTRNEDERFVPASNVKLVTAAAALLFWGPDHRFKTELYLPDRKIRGGVVRGDIYLKGFGDPSLSTARYRDEVYDFDTASVEDFARGLRYHGVRAVEGRVLGDESFFDRRRICGTWTSALQLECGRLSALTVDESLRDGNRVTAPAAYAARMLTEALRRAGIKVAGAPGTGKVPSSYVLEDREYSAPLRDLLARMDKHSDNFFAEIIVKGLGKQFAGAGTTAAGVQVLRETLEDVGAEPRDYTLVDGSGLSYEDRLSPQALMQVLRVLYRSQAFSPYYDSLAVGAVDGTLEDRMKSTAAAGNARAKTGSLAIATCLSGYVKAADERRLAFVILMNGAGLDYWHAAKTQDALVAALARARLTTPHTLLITRWRRVPFRRDLDVVGARGGNLRAGVVQ